MLRLWHVACSYDAASRMDAGSGEKQDMETLIAFAFVMGLPLWLLVEEIVKRWQVPQPQPVQVAYKPAHVGRA